MNKKELSDEIMVSVNCAVYNHEKYLAKCLDSILMQKTTFKFEVLIHDDASTDRSAEIIEDYELRYPEIIKPIYQTQNQYSKGVKISSRFQYPRALGKYIAMCEGDDYWIDENKLQKQYDALEKHGECMMCVHKVEDVSEEGYSIGNFHPQFKIKKNIISSDEFIKLTEYWAFQTSSYFFVNIPELKEQDLPLFYRLSGVGDTPLMLLFGSKGKVYYYDSIMSCYRHGAPDSWNERRKKEDIISKKKRIISDINVIKEFDKYTGFKYTNTCREHILAYQYRFYKETNQYRKMLESRYSEQFKQDRLIVKTFTILSVYTPHFVKMYRKLKIMVRRII